MIAFRRAASILWLWLAATPAVAADPSPATPVPLSPPPVSAIPSGPLGDAIRYGERIVRETGAVAGAYIGNALACTNCHLDAGRTAYASPLAGLTGLFPEYRARRGRVETLEERINDCFLRSMNGKALPPSSREMIGLLAYIAWLSEGVPTGREVDGRGFRELAAPAPPDPAHGRTVYVAKCAACHGADGGGIEANGRYVFPPLWGARSFNTGAGMARVSVSAAFIQTNMPLHAADLTVQQAFDVAAYFTTQPRPEFRGQKDDWPKGDRPADAR